MFPLQNGQIILLYNKAFLLSISFFSETFINNLFSWFSFISINSSIVISLLILFSSKEKLKEFLSNFVNEINEFIISFNFSPELKSKEIIFLLNKNSTFILSFSLSLFLKNNYI